MSSTYGYSSLVGEWFGSIAVESDLAPTAAVCMVLGRLQSLMESTHRPSNVRVSWLELDFREEELAFHELEEYAVTSWKEILEHVEGLRVRTQHAFAISALVIDLETRIVEADGEVWRSGAATLQLSIDQPELHPTTIEVNYSTFLDAWLSTTYDSKGQPRSNRTVADANRPTLERILRGLRTLMGSTFQVGQSQTYPSAITESGFRDLDDLPSG